MNSKHRSMLHGIAIVALLIEGGCGKSEPQPIPIKGTVTINGEKPDGMVISLRPANEGSQQKIASAVTKAGEFVLSTNAESDGVIPGEYIVCFAWPASLTGPSSNRLPSSLNDPGKSKHRVTITPDTSVLTPFELTNVPVKKDGTKMGTGGDVFGR